MKILIKDNIIGRDIKNTFRIETSKKVLTVQELIKLRVFEEVENYNACLPKYFSGLIIQPTDTEVTLNGYKMNNKKKIDAEKQFYLAIDAFVKNRFFLIINNNQIDTLEEKIEVKENLELNFIKLTPLVGG